MFTLSPVRHYPGELVVNARSKALLLTAIHEVCGDMDGMVYFPVYEIVMDELRDYRFYKEDMIHLSPLAVRMIADYFISSCFEPDAMRRLAEGRKRLAASRHQEDWNKNVRNSGICKF